MNKEEFINWLESLGFRKTWESSSNEYSIFPVSTRIPQTGGLFGPKLFFTIDGDITTLHYSNTNGSVSFGSNFGKFPIEQIGDFEKYIILSKLSEFFDEIPPSFRQCLRELSLKNILED